MILKKSVLLFKPKILQWHLKSFMTNSKIKKLSWSKMKQKKETPLSLLIFTKDISSTIKGAMEATEILRYILEVILTIRSQPLILVTLVLSS